MPQRLHVVAETTQFLRDADAAGVSEPERLAIVDSVAENPIQGVEIQARAVFARFGLQDAARARVADIG